MRSLNPWPIFPSNLDPPVARSLSIQFILQGLIDSFQLVKTLQTAPPLSGIHIKEELHALSKELEKLLLFSLENPFAQKSSLFDKLCFYSEILIQASQVKGHEIPVILEEMRNTILSIRPQMLIWKKGQTPAEQIRLSLFDLYHDLHQQLCRFFTSLSLFLKEARSDENVLIYLIENKETLNPYLGPRYIETLLESFFPTGYAQLRAAIYEGFTRRGFDTFLASVEPLIEAMEWETPCYSTTTP